MSSERRLCASVSRANGEDPIGTIKPYDTYLAIEIAPPWKGDIALSVNYPPGLWDALLRAWKSGAVTRSTGLVPDPDYSVEGYTRVLMLRRPDKPFARFDRSEYLLPAGELIGFVDALADGEAERFDDYLAYLQPARKVRDILVCTHGANDACCGKFGYPVYDRLRHIVGDREDLRVWRSSHLGGHRFAATLVDLPEGRGWGHLDADTAERVLRRDVPAAGLTPKYRGWAGLRDVYEQVADRAILAREGWGWTDHAKYVEGTQVTGKSGEVTGIRIGYVSQDGADSGVYEADVEPSGGVMTLTKTGSEPLEEIPQYRVARLEKL